MDNKSFAKAKLLAREYSKLYSNTVTGLSNCFVANDQLVYCPTVQVNSDMFDTAFELARLGNKNVEIKVGYESGCQTMYYFISDGVAFITLKHKEVEDNA